MACFHGISFCRCGLFPFLQPAAGGAGGSGACCDKCRPSIVSTTKIKPLIVKICKSASASSKFFFLFFFPLKVFISFLLHQNIILVLSCTLLFNHLHRCNKFVNFCLLLALLLLSSTRLLFLFFLFYYI